MQRARIQTVLLMASMTMAVACDQKRQTSRSEPGAHEGSSGVEKLKQDAKDAVTATRAYLIQQKEQLEKTLGNKMTDFEKQLSDLKSKPAGLGDQAKAEWSNTLAQLQQKKQVAAKKLEQLKNSTTDKWQDFKSGAEAAVADLEKGLKEAFARSKEEDKTGRQ